jgi:hypothetical protein
MSYPNAPQDSVASAIELRMDISQCQQPYVGAAQPRHI